MKSTPDTVAPAGFQTHRLDDECVFHIGSIPANLAMDPETFETIWELHPAEFHEISMFGRKTRTPRWQQAYGKDYRFTGQVNRALPIPDLLQPYLDWVRNTIHPKLNGLLLNWYDGRLGHYIGPHHDDTRDLILSTPIVTISIGENRVFRFSNKSAKVDSVASSGQVIVIPWDTNLQWKHSVPRYKKYQDKRVSITLRAFV